MKKTEEFENVETGLPKEINLRKANQRVLFPFILAGILLACGVLIFGTVLNISLSTNDIYKTDPVLVSLINVISTSAYMGTVTLLVGLMQSIFLQKRIKSRSLLYIFISGMGGIISGLIGGALMSFIFSKDNFDIPLAQILLGNYSATSIIGLAIRILLLITKSLVTGVTIGLITGSITAIAQNLFMRNSKYGFKWLRYNMLIWVISCSLAWIISITVGEFIEYSYIVDSIAAAFVLISHGIAILLFLASSPEIEFS